VNKNLKLEIIKKFDTQLEFAKAIKLNEQFVSRVITERSFLSPQEQQRWAKVLKCKVDTIFPEEVYSGSI